MATTNSHHLTDLQFRFCQEYVRNGFSNATAAYHAAGYKATGAAVRSGAARLLTNANVTDYLTELQQKASEQAEVDATYVIRRLKMEAEREGQGSSHAARVSALNSLGKHLGVFGEPEPDDRPILVVTNIMKMQGTGDA